MQLVACFTGGGKRQRRKGIPKVVGRYNKQKNHTTLHDTFLQLKNAKKQTRKGQEQGLLGTQQESDCLYLPTFFPLLGQLVVNNALFKHNILLMPQIQNKSTSNTNNAFR